VAAAGFAVAALLVVVMYGRGLQRDDVPLSAASRALAVPATAAVFVAVAAWLASRLVSGDVWALGIGAAVTLVVVGLLLRGARGTLRDLRGSLPSASVREPTRASDGGDSDGERMDAPTAA
jgi:hypothetical protein